MIVFFSTEEKCKLASQMFICMASCDIHKSTCTYKSALKDDGNIFSETVFLLEVSLSTDQLNSYVSASWWIGEGAMSVAPPRFIVLLKKYMKNVFVRKKCIILNITFWLLPSPPMCLSVKNFFKINLLQFYISHYETRHGEPSYEYTKNLWSGNFDISPLSSTAGT